jgi:ATP-dependent DNA helicase RecQ
VPSRRSGGLVPDFAERLAVRIGLPCARALIRAGDAPPQQEMRNGSQQVANVRGQFKVDATRVRPGPVLLVDDIRYSGWTLATVGAQLRLAGADCVHPLVLRLAGA